MLIVSSDLCFRINTDLASWGVCIFLSFRLFCKHRDCVYTSEPWPFLLLLSHLCRQTLCYRVSCMGGNFIVWAVSSFWVIKTFPAFSMASEIKLLMRHVGSTASTGWSATGSKTPNAGGLPLLLSFPLSLSPFLSVLGSLGLLFLNSLHPMCWVCSLPQRRAGWCAGMMCLPDGLSVTTKAPPRPVNPGFWDPSERNLWEIMVLSYVCL